MAKLEGQTIAASYDQLLHVDTEGGGATTTLVPIKDGNNDTTFCLQLATTSALIVDDAKLYFGTGSDASIEYDEDGADNLSIAGSDVSIADGIGLIVGNTAQVAMGEVTSEVQILGTTETDACLAIGLASTTDALSPSLKFVKGAHATIGNHSVTVADNEELGKIQAYGSDATDSDTLSSEIAFNIDDDGVGTGTLGGEILLKTSGKDGTLDTAVTIDSSQAVTLAGTLTSGAITSAAAFTLGSGSQFKEVARGQPSWATATATNVYTVGASEDGMWLALLTGAAGQFAMAQWFISTGSGVNHSITEIKAISAGAAWSGDEIMMDHSHGSTTTVDYVVYSVEERR